MTATTTKFPRTCSIPALKAMKIKYVLHFDNPLLLSAILLVGILRGILRQPTHPHLMENPHPAPYAARMLLNHTHGSGSPLSLQVKTAYPPAGQNRIGRDRVSSQSQNPMHARPHACGCPMRDEMTPRTHFVAAGGWVWAGGPEGGLQMQGGLGFG